MAHDASSRRRAKKEPVGDHFTIRELEGALARLGEASGEVKSRLIAHLFVRGEVDVDGITAAARDRLAAQGELFLEPPADPIAHRTYLQYLADEVEKGLLGAALATLHRSYVQDAIEFGARRMHAARLGTVLRRHGSFQATKEALAEFLDSPQETPIKLHPSEAVEIRVALIRTFLSEQLPFIEVARHHLRVSTFSKIFARMIGNASTVGRIGGKAAGMLLANGIGADLVRGISAGMRRSSGRISVVSRTDSEIYDGAIAREPSPPPTPASARPGAARSRDELRFAYPESWFLRSDVFDEFLEFNGLQDLHNQKYKTPDEIHDEYPDVQERFLSGQFPHHIFTQLRDLLEDIGEGPLILRSSSLLEDNLRMAFSGKYDSEFIANRGPTSQRLMSFLHALKLVYASTLGPDPLLYRRYRGVLDYHESMAVLIQRVVGRTYGRWFCPLIAGVGFSRNAYCWSKELRPEDGLLRVVMGLGTHAVDRVGDDYPRIVGLTKPTLRPQIGAAEIRRYSQRSVDAIDLETDEVVSVPFRELVRAAEEAGDDTTGLDLVLSVERGGMLRPLRGQVDVDVLDDAVITLERLLAKTRFPELLRELLGNLEEAYSSPVDIEFAIDPPIVYILQCRPLFHRESGEAVEVPEVDHGDVLFEAAQTVPNRVIDGIDRVVFVDPVAYERLAPDDKRATGRLVSQVNAALGAAKETFILMGPGRWGSRNLDLGVPVRYADIHHTRMLVEVAYEKGGVRPEASFGTHFFQDLVEADIVPLAILPGEAGHRLADERLRSAPNGIRQLVPDCSDALAAAVRVCRAADLDDAELPRTLRVVLDGESGRAMGYFG